LKRRLPQIQRLVNDYNSLLQNLPTDQRPPLFNIDDFGVNDLEKRYKFHLWNWHSGTTVLSSGWYYQSPPSTHGWSQCAWATRPDVTQGIELILRRDRAKEEQAIVEAEAQRTYHWVQARLQTLYTLAQDVYISPSLRQDQYYYIVLDAILVAENGLEYGKNLLDGSALASLQGEYFDLMPTHALLIGFFFRFSQCGI
jgi:hypothetical protein